MPRFSRRQFLPLTQLGAICLAMTFLCACGNGGSSSPSENAGTCAQLPPASNSDFLVHLTPFMNHLCYQKQNWQHDAQVRTSDGVHPFVRVWYSPSLFDWITVKNRIGHRPDAVVYQRRSGCGRGVRGAPMHSPARSRPPARPSACPSGRQPRAQA